MAKCRLRTRERVKGNTAFPFTIPAAPQRNRCFALRSPPAPLPAVGLTRVTRPIPGARPSGQRVALFKIVPDDFVLSRQTSVRHPWRPALVIGSSSHRFQRGLNSLAARSAPGGHKDVAAVGMRENESAMAKKVEGVHSIYCSERAGVAGVYRRCADRMHKMQFAGVQHQSWCSRRAR